MEDIENDTRCSGVRPGSSSSSATWPLKKSSATPTITFGLPRMSAVAVEADGGDEAGAALQRPEHAGHQRRRMAGRQRRGEHVTGPHVGCRDERVDLPSQGRRGDLTLSPSAAADSGS